MQCSPANSAYRSGCQKVLTCSELGLRLLENRLAHEPEKTTLGWRRNFQNAAPKHWVPVSVERAMSDATFA